MKLHVKQRFFTCALCIEHGPMHGVVTWVQLMGCRCIYLPAVYEV